MITPLFSESAKCVLHISNRYFPLIILKLPLVVVMIIVVYVYIYTLFWFVIQYQQRSCIDIWNDYYGEVLFYILIAIDIASIPLINSIKKYLTVKTRLFGDWL